MCIDLDICIVSLCFDVPCIALSCRLALGLQWGWLWSLPAWAWAMPKRGRKPEDNDVAVEAWVAEYNAFVDKMLAKGEFPLNLAAYSHLAKTNAVCLRSLVKMEHRLDMILDKVPGAVLNLTKLQKVLEILGGQRPNLINTSKPVGEWVAFVSKHLRIALAHLRAVALRPMNFESKIKVLADQE